MSTPTKPAPRRRPVSVTCVAVAGLTFSAFYLARLFLGLSPLPPALSVPFWYLPLSGAVWGALGLVLSVGLWRGSATAYRWVFWALPAYFLWYWIDRLVFLRSDFVRVSHPAALVVSAGALTLLYAALTRSGARAYFRERVDE